MGVARKPFQGVLNIVRFNWHFYLVAAVILVAIVCLKHYLPAAIQPYIVIASLLAVLTISISLLVSFYIYDLSDLYALKWLPPADGRRILNINAGFDETSAIISTKFPNAALTVCDFYDPKKHTEISIKRARKALPPVHSTIQVSTENLPFKNGSFDLVLAIFSAHEIRNETERIRFFKELARVTSHDGQLLVTEHHRDFYNFLAYTIGFFHFHSRSTWLRTFTKAGLVITDELKTTPFITSYVLSRNGTTP